MITVPITLTIAGACGLIALWLAFRVSQVRVRDKVSLGDASNKTLLARMRAHGNFAEYAPLFLILLALLEIAYGSRWSLWMAGAGFVPARIAHAIGMGHPAPNALRAGGALVTWLLLGALSLYAIAAPYLNRTQP